MIQINKPLFKCVGIVQSIFIHKSMVWKHIYFVGMQRTQHFNEGQFFDIQAFIIHIEQNSSLSKDLETPSNLVTDRVGETVEGVADGEHVEECPEDGEDHDGD